MISVIACTMWKYVPFYEYYLGELIKSPSIGEIIIVNNDVSKTPNHPILQHKKIKLLNQEQNIYINPAWNLGVETSINDKLCFFNDDAMIDTRIFDLMDNWLTDQVGACGIVEYLEGHNQPKFIDGTITLTMRTTENCYGFGVVCFIHKNNWIPVPSELRLGFGDVWLFESQVFLKQKPNYLISNIYFNHAGSRTCSTLSGVSALHEMESAAYRRIAHQLWGAPL